MTDWEWKWMHEPKNSKYPRMGAISSAPFDGVRFAVFGGVDSLNYGLVDENDGDPLFPGPYVVPGPFADEKQVENIARAIMATWKAARAPIDAARAKDAS